MHKVQKVLKLKLVMAILHLTVTKSQALVAQSVERNHGKVEVTGSNPVGGSFSSL